MINDEYQEKLNEFHNEIKKLESKINELKELQTVLLMEADSRESIIETVGCTDLSKISIYSLDRLNHFEEIVSGYMIYKNENEEIVKVPEYLFKVVDIQENANKKELWLLGLEPLTCCEFDKAKAYWFNCDFLKEVYFYKDKKVKAFQFDFLTTKDINNRFSTALQSGDEFLKLGFDYWIVDDKEEDRDYFININGKLMYDKSDEYSYIVPFIKISM